MAIDYQQYVEYIRDLTEIAENRDADMTARTLAKAALVLDRGLVDVVQEMQDQRAK